MRYDASWAALFRPQNQPALPAAWFAGLGDDALCAELSRLVYFDFEAQRTELEDALAGHGLELALALSVRQLPINSQAMVARRATGEAFVVFRGTQSDSPWDLITDLMALPLRWPGPGLVHHGFRNGYRVLHDGLAQWLAANPPPALTATGHSLGGALATLFAARNPAARLVTFGSPAVGNAGFTALFASRAVARYRDCRDLVPRIPPEWVIYRQLGGLRYIDRHGQVCAETPSPREIRHDMAQALRDYWSDLPAGMASVPARSLADHAPINYVSALLGRREV